MKSITGGTIGDAGAEAAKNQSAQLQILNQNQNNTRNPRLSMFSE
jgi:hypothetical protein